MGTEPPGLELAQVIRRFGDAVAGPLTSDQRRALRDAARCRTKELGGHVRRCGDCGHGEIAYNSCRNRHCPKCHASQQAGWFARQQQHLLPCQYFHVVFTLPAEVNALVPANPVTVYNALFAAAGEAVRRVAADPKHLGAQVGSLFVLHTWGQTLQRHPHVHGIVTGGGLSCDGSGTVDDAPRWVGCRPGFFLPVRVLSRVFRDVYCHLLEAAFGDGRLVGFADGPAFHAFLTPLRERDWVVYCQAPMAGPAVVLKYLARYSHRVAFGNSRLTAVGRDTVSFTYKDYRRDGRVRTMTLPGAEFLRRWLQHVLPRGFVRIRSCGLLANRGRDAKLAKARWLLLAAAAAGPSSPPEPEKPEPRRPTCPHCGGSQWHIESRFAADTPPPGLWRCAAADTS
jgi:hypothetical protein